MLVKATQAKTFTQTLSGDAIRMRLVKLDTDSAFTVVGSIHPEAAEATITPGSDGFYDMLGIINLQIAVTAGLGVVGNISGRHRNDI